MSNANGSFLVALISRADSASGPSQWVGARAAEVFERYISGKEVRPISSLVDPFLEGGEWFIIRNGKKYPITLLD
jgi:hypothetical protein